jgi:hypothetical protein
MLEVQGSVPRHATTRFSFAWFLRALVLNVSAAAQIDEAVDKYMKELDRMRDVKSQELEALK